MNGTARTRRYLSEHSMLLNIETEEVAVPELAAG